MQPRLPARTARTALLLQRPRAGRPPALPSHGRDAESTLTRAFPGETQLLRGLKLPRVPQHRSGWQGARWHWGTLGASGLLSYGFVHGEDRAILCTGVVTGQRCHLVSE